VGRRRGKVGPKSATIKYFAKPIVRAGSRIPAGAQCPEEIGGGLAAATKKPKKAEAGKNLIKVWDLSTRIFHWLLVAFVVASFITVKIGGNAMPYHQKCGYIILALLFFRIAWGFFGSRSSRFVSFVCSPATVLRYAAGLLRPGLSRYLGHNPLGAWSIIAMLLVLLVQSGTGLFANDDIFTEGPLAKLVSKAASDWLTRIHRLNADIIVVLVVIHVLAVIYYLLVKRNNLIKPMITGYKVWSGNVSPEGERYWVAVSLALLSALVVFLLVR
jgi:cytochrome b